MKELGEVFKEYAELNKRDLPMLVEDQSKKLIEEVVRQTHKATNEDIAQGVANNVPFFIRAPKSKRRGKQTLKQQIEDAYKDGNYDNGMSRCEPEQYYNDTYKK